MKADKMIEGIIKRKALVETRAVYQN